jgi:hypothetical protein
LTDLGTESSKLMWVSCIERVVAEVQLNESTFYWTCD